MPKRVAVRRTALAFAVVAALSGCRATPRVALPAPSEPIVHLPQQTVPVNRQQTAGLADGVVPPGTTVSDPVPAVTGLDPRLRKALRRAAAAAARDGVVIYVESGWRSRTYQKQLFLQAVVKYGSRTKAERWVARPGTSVHERGDAVDVGRSAAIRWLSEHGARYGLCQVYRNERWHYELRPRAVEHGCPRMYADPTQDPRLQ
jgi:hypothetical protein